MRIGRNKAEFYITETVFKRTKTVNLHLSYITRNFSVNSMKDGVGGDYQFSGKYPDDLYFLRAEVTAILKALDFAEQELMSDEPELIKKPSKPAKQKPPVVEKQNNPS